MREKPGWAERAEYLRERSQLSLLWEVKGEIN